jgi:hypothetical protein
LVSSGNNLKEAPFIACAMNSSVKLLEGIGLKALRDIKNGPTLDQSSYNWDKKLKKVSKQRNHYINPFI